MIEQQLIDKWINEMDLLGYDDSKKVKIFRLANKKFNHMITDEAKDIDCVWYEIVPMASIEVEPDIFCFKCEQPVVENMQTSELFCPECDKE